MSDSDYFNSLVGDGTSLTNGQVALGSLFYLEDQGELPHRTATNIVTNVVSYGFTVATQECKQGAVAEQTLEMDCDSEMGDKVFTNFNCERCKARVEKYLSERAKLDQDAHDLNPDYAVPELDSDTKKKLEGSFTGSDEIYKDGICKFQCMQCVARKIYQEFQLEMIQECDVTQSTFISAFTSGMSRQAERELADHTNKLRKMGFDIKTQDDLSYLGIHIANTIRQITKSELLTSLRSGVIALQGITVGDDSTSVVIQKFKQSASINMLATLVETFYGRTEFKQNLGYIGHDGDNPGILQDAVAKNYSFSDLLHEAVQSVNTLKGLLRSMIGKLMVTLVAVLIGALLVFGFIIYYQPKALLGGSSDTVIA